MHQKKKDVQSERDVGGRRAAGQNKQKVAWWYQNLEGDFFRIEEPKHQEIKNKNERRAPPPPEEATNFLSVRVCLSRFDDPTDQTEEGIGIDPGLLVDTP